MTTAHADHLLIGGGIASATCAQALRDSGETGSIVLLTRELDPPYHRPPTTKQYLRDGGDRSDHFVLPAEWYEQHSVELRTRSGVKKIDTDARTAELQDGSTISYGDALIATGAQVRRIDFEGDDLDGLHYLRALGNADSLRRDAASAQQAVLIGGSYIGCEVAATLRELGLEVTVVMQEEHPMERGFGPAVGRFVRGVLEERGITVLGGKDLVACVGNDDETVRAVRTADGLELPAQVVVLGTGAVPDVTLARASGLSLGETGGVACDARLMTSADGLFAAGDICEWDSQPLGRRLRVEHEDVAAAHGRTVAANMRGEDRAHTELPYFWTELSDWIVLEYVGNAPSWDDEQVTGKLDEGYFSVRYLKDGELVACCGAGGHPGLDEAREQLSAD